MCQLLEVFGMLVGTPSLTIRVPHFLSQLECEWIHLLYFLLYLSFFCQGLVNLLLHQHLTSIILYFEPQVGMFQFHHQILSMGQPPDPLLLNLVQSLLLLLVRLSLILSKYLGCGTYLLLSPVTLFLHLLLVYYIKLWTDFVSHLLKIPLWWREIL